MTDGFLMTDFVVVCIDGKQFEVRRQVAMDILIERMLETRGEKSRGYVSAYLDLLNGSLSASTERS